MGSDWIGPPRPPFSHEGTTDTTKHIGKGYVLSLEVVKIAAGNIILHDTALANGSDLSSAAELLPPIILAGTEAPFQFTWPHGLYYEDGLGVELTASGIEVNVTYSILRSANRGA